MKLLLVLGSSVFSLFLSSQTVADEIVDTQALTLKSVEGVWFPKEKAEKLLKEHEAYPHLVEMSKLADQILDARKDQVLIQSQSLDLCQKALASCQSDQDSILHSPYLQIGSGFAIGIGTCFLTRK